jgi:hypothetical protein
MTTSLPQNTAHEQRSDEYTPKKEDKFSFGLWFLFSLGNTNHYRACEKVDNSSKVEFANGIEFGVS